MKFAVHWAPPVKVCTPGWTAARDEGAHVGAAPAVPTVASGARQPTAATAAEAVAHLRSPVTQETRTYPSLVEAAPIYPAERPPKPPARGSRTAPEEKGHTWLR